MTGPTAGHLAFRPHPWTVGGHRQTLLGYLCRLRLRWTLPAEDVVVEGSEGVRILLRATWQPGSRDARPALVLIHGLGGSDATKYAVAAGLYAFGRGWHVVRMNLRGAGDSEALCPILYNAGLDSDVLAVLESLARHVRREAVVGFSLGANLTLLALGRGAGRVPAAVVGAAAVSPPLDLAACAGAIDRPENRLYQSYFMRQLRASYRRRQGLRPDLYEAGREVGLRSIWEYDEAITARYGGFRNAEDYYARSSAGPHLRTIDRPTLLLAAEDDPMIPAGSLAPWLPATSGCVRPEVLATGGHVGFVAPTAAPGRFWAAERIVKFLEECAAA